MGFQFVHRQTGAMPTILDIVLRNDEVLSVGEMVNINTGEAEAAGTNDAAFVGIALEALDNADDGLSIKVIVDKDAIYRVSDDNARLIGATLDLASGGLGVTTPNTNKDFIVIKTSTATEPTHVMITPAEHLFG